MWFSPDVVLALLYATQGQDPCALLQVLASSVLVYALCSVAMWRAHQQARQHIAPLPPNRVAHDVLIQGGQGLMLSLYATALQLPAGSRGRRELERLLDEGDRWLAHSRQVLQRQQQGDGRLEQRLLELPERAGWPAPLAYCVSVLGCTQALSPDVQQVCLQLVQAMLATALPDAHRLEVELCFGRGQLGLRVCHDGSATGAAIAAHALDVAQLAALLRPVEPAALQLQLWRGARAGVELSLQLSLPGQPALAPVSTVRLCWQRLRRQLYPF
ncbi:hypothetical protein [Duganella fentianensis]|uniref:hypothetical protein n=1 Tax=Duganella fentianensis TaxID=2692177 RepID=UPI0032B2C7D3